MVELISILILVAFALLYIALEKKDSTLIYFAGFLILLTGLNIMNTTVSKYVNIDSIAFIGLVFVFLSFYLMLRTSIELIKDPEENK